MAYIVNPTAPALLLLILGVWQIGAAPEIELPQGTKTCKLDSDTRDICIKEALQDMLPKLYGGFSYLNIPPMDPLVLNRTHFDYNRGPMQGSMNMKTANVYGLSRTEIRNVKTSLDEKTMQLEIEGYYPRILVAGVYKADGQFNGYRMNSRGNFNLTFKHVTSKTRLTGEFVEVDGERYLHLTGIDLHMDMDNMRLSATGIFPEPALNQMALDFVNQNWPSMYRVILTETKSVWQPRLLDSINAFLMVMPLRKMLF